MSALLIRTEAKKAVLLCAALAAAGCSTGGEAGKTDLDILEELEAVRSIEDPGTRVEEFERFAASYPEHPFREDAYTGVLETLAEEMGDSVSAEERFESFLSAETDPSVRGSLWLARLRHFLERGGMRGLRVLEEALDRGERDYRMLLYATYMVLGEGAGDGGRRIGPVDRLFGELIGSADTALREDHARTLYAGWLEKTGRADLARAELEKASRYPFAAESLGHFLWEEGRREESVEAYIRLAAGAPGYRERYRLDSLYSLVHPGAGDLEEKLAARRILDGDPLPEMEFVDIEGGAHSISRYRGDFLLISAFSPT